ncbi:hypothetical protein MPTK1_5g06540 [Marchantia polymorpha subsp. ruderalis]|uniref:Uncharacterized protein n=2 Tax=Marchantia polymorpha TaxID=3197 RepID=A0AAF6BFL7_MARPO|nr:hypothetical protein MARPO_0171s0029 [Marchantia polymorpha]BBN10801.1 hypothetical protein Mp_5g06540 [Marchantia polymorpha subsp. ruderalis]|eukprot:PTQ28191.1 hypothetical protein MARPO_0171s0029 [Marchantia polymorpha]
MRWESAFIHSFNKIKHMFRIRTAILFVSAREDAKVCLLQNHSFILSVIHSFSHSFRSLHPSSHGASCFHNSRASEQIAFSVRNSCPSPLTSRSRVFLGHY